MSKPNIKQVMEVLFKDHLTPKQRACLEGVLEGFVEGYDEEIKAYKEKVFDDLLNIFDEQIGKEQQERSEVLENNGGKKDCAWWAHNGRVDGVDTGRYLVESYFAAKESADE